MAGRFFWYDVMTTDTGAAREFYSAVVGWGTQDSGAPGSEYAVFTVADRGVAGLMPIPDDARKAGVRPSWMGYIAVDDLVRAAASLERQGGKLHRGPTEVPGVIRFAVVSDPQGAGFLIAQPLITDPPPEPPLGTPGTVGWRELRAADWKSAFAFYEKMFGWTKTEAMDMGPMGTYQMFATGDDTVGGMMNNTAAETPYWSYYFNVERIAAAAERCVAGGGTVVNGPHQVPGGQWIIQCLDPQGAGFALVAPKK